MDISNAFNAACTIKIKEIAIRRRLPVYLYRIIRSFLEDGKIQTYGFEFRIAEECPPGSSLGPTLWLLAMEGLFDVIDDTETVKLQAFADDLIVCISDVSVKKIEGHWKNIWERLENWSAESKLRFNEEKT